MKYISTRGEAEPLSFTQALLAGLAPDGGLYLPAHYPKFSREEIADFARRTGNTIYHPVGVCKMGPTDDPSAVVDPRLRVRGIDGLRVIDASIMPAVTTANTNSTAIMIGEKGAAMLLEDAAA